MTVRLTLDKPLIEALGDQGLVIVLGAEIDADVNRRVCALAAHIESRRLPGIVDVVPSFTAVAVHYEAELVMCKQGELAYSAMRRQLTAAISSMPVLSAVAAASEPSATSGVIEIPVCFGGDDGPDLEQAAETCGLDVETMTALHSMPEPMRVYMLGFAPGAPYIGRFDARVSLPRRQTPRVRVPAGSIGIANRQAVVYPVEGPGGWSLIGRTPLVLFDASRERPSLLEPGLLVRFKAIGADEFRAWPRS